MNPDNLSKINRNLSTSRVESSNDDNNLERVRKPDVPPNTTKDFSKLLDKDATEEAAVDVKIESPYVPKKAEQKFVEQTTESGINVDTQQPAALIKESKVTPRLGKELAIAAPEEPRAISYVEEVPVDKQIIMSKESTAQASLQYSTQKDEVPRPVVVNTDHVIPLSNKNEKPVVKTKKDDAVAIDQTVDPSQVNPIAMGVGAVESISNLGTPSTSAAVSKEIHAIAQQIIDSIQVTTKGSEVDTTITLKNLPLFDDVKVTVTSDASAPKQVNIKFENLTAEAKNIVDMQDNQAALKQALDKIGYTVPMITTTTYVEQPIQTGGSSIFGKNQSREGFGGNQPDTGKEKQAR
jgi:hypothetical protein